MNVYKIQFFILGDMSNLDSKVDSTKAKVEELKDKWGSGELKIEELKSSHHEIKGNFITYILLPYSREH